MFKFIKSWFSSNLDSILRDITLKVEQLHAHAAVKVDEAADHAAAATVSTALSQAAANEASRAKGVAVKLTSLVS